jgi:hypothetical protein
MVEIGQPNFSVERMAGGVAASRFRERLAAATLTFHVGPLMRELAFFCGVLLLVGCTAPRPQFSDVPETRSASAPAWPASQATEPTKLNRADVLQMALDYAHEKKWDIINSGMPGFDEARRVWRVFINTKQNGGPMIVCIKDSTKEISFTRGE